MSTQPPKGTYAGREVYRALLEQDDQRPRSSSGIGVSSLGGCARQVWYRLHQFEPCNGMEQDRLRSIVGTAMHEKLEALYPPPPRIKVPGVELYGTPDRISHGFLDDFKFPALKGVRYYRSHGVSRQYRWQVHTYAYAWNEGRAPDEPDYVHTVRLIFIPVDGTSKDIYTWTEPYDQSAALEAVEWFVGLRDWEDQPPPPEKPPSFCASYCPFYGALCEGQQQPPAQQQPEDPWVEEAAREFYYADENIKGANMTKDAARAALEEYGAHGQYGPWVVTWGKAFGRTYPIIKHVSGGAW